MKTQLRFLCVPVLLLVVFVELAAQNPVRCNSGPLSEQQLSDAVGQLPEARLIQFITSCGVSFVLDEMTETRLKRAGATSSVLTAIRDKAPKPLPPTPPPPAPTADPELDSWNAIKDSKEANVFADYLSKYPTGRFSSEAQIKRRELTVTRLRPRIEQAIRDRQWDAADNGINELLKVQPINNEIREWQLKVSIGRDDLKAWNAIKDGDNAQAFNDYLSRYPEGQFRAAASAKLQEIKTASLRREISQAIGDSRWDLADEAVNRLEELEPADNEIKNWRNSISAGRTSDLRNVRSRIEEMVRAGMTLQQVKSAAAAMDLPSRLGADADRLIEDTYTDLSRSIPGATIWLYKVDAFWFVGAADPTIYLRDVPLAKLKDGRFFAITVQPGTYHLHRGNGSLPLEVVAKSGEQLFVKVFATLGPMELKDRSEAEKDFRKLKPLEQQDILNNRVSTTRP